MIRSNVTAIQLQLLYKHPEKLIGNLIRRWMSSESVREPKQECLIFQPLFTLGDIMAFLEQPKVFRMNIGEMDPFLLSQGTLVTRINDQFFQEQKRFRKCILSHGESKRSHSQSRPVLTWS